MSVREKYHRLPREYYKGEASVSFTLCFNNHTETILTYEIVSVFTDILISIVSKEDCIVPVYCFMPDHQHLIITGTTDDSDILKTVVSYKQKTGFWMSAHKPDISWQKNFYDHIIRKKEDLAPQVKYILDNPVRKGLVHSWQDFPFRGSIGCNLEDVLNGII